MISELGIHSEHIIGRDFKKGEVPQFIVPGGYWFAAEVINKDDYSLVGCTVSPGFSFEDFELKTRKELVSLFPDKEKIKVKIGKNFVEVNLITYYKKIHESYYVLSPAGKGLDTHRFWESLYLDSIPIVKRTNTILDDFYLKFPCLMIDDWENL